jgi:hypothetical protein
MREACGLVWSVLALLFRSRASLEAEILILRHQLNIQRRHLPKKLTFNAMDRLIFVALYRSNCPQCADDREAGDCRPLASDRVQVVLAPEVSTSFRPTDGSGRNTTADPRDEPCQSAVGSAADPWRVAQARHRDRQTSVAKYMARRRGPPCQGWKTFLRNHADGIAAMDLFVVPTISFRLLYGLLIMRHGRRQVLWFGVRAHPTAEWIANQLTEACGWDQAPRYLIRDLDGAYGDIFIRRLRSMGIRDRPTSPRSESDAGIVVGYGVGCRYSPRVDGRHGPALGI